MADNVTKVDELTSLHLSLQACLVPFCLCNLLAVVVVLMSDSRSAVVPVPVSDPVLVPGTPIGLIGNLVGRRPGMASDADRPWLVGGHVDMAAFYEQYSCKCKKLCSRK